MDPFRPTIEQFAKFAPTYPRYAGKERVDDNRLIGGIVHVLKTHQSRMDALPKIYRPKKAFPPVLHRDWNVLIPMFGYHKQGQESIED